MYFISCLDFDCVELSATWKCNFAGTMMLKGTQRGKGWRNGQGRKGVLWNRYVLCPFWRT